MVHLHKIRSADNPRFWQLLWTLLLCGSLWWHYTALQESAIDQARTAARSSYASTLMMREWVATHGGVYVPETDQTPANPYLKNFPERDLKTPTGRNLTLVNPSYMTRQLFEMTEGRFGVRGHITSFDPIRPQNSPDSWESSALKAFGGGAQEVSSVELFHGEDHLRLMRPLFITKPCLRCHGHQGYKEGDLRGGLSVSVPMAQFYQNKGNRLLVSLVGHLMVWLLGLWAIGWAWRHAASGYAAPVAASLREVPAVNGKSLLGRFLTLFLPLAGLVTLITIQPLVMDYRNRQQAVDIEDAHHVDLMKDHIQETVMNIITDLRVLAAEQEYQELFQDVAQGSPQHREVERLLLAFSTIKGIYDQVRILSLDGKELCRVDYNRGTPRIVPHRQLEDKSKRYYFQDMQGLKQGEIYISPMDLSLVDGEIETPLKPVVRVAMQIAGADGTKRGWLILNLLAELILNDLSRIYDLSDGIPMLLDREGNWLKADQPENEWGFMLKERQQHSFAQYFPREWQKISATENGQFRNDNGAFTFSTVHLLSTAISGNNGERVAFRSSGEILDARQFLWKIVVQIPPKTLELHIRAAVEKGLPWLLVLLLVSAAISWLLIVAQNQREQGRADLTKSEKRLAMAVEVSEAVILDYRIAPNPQIFYSEKLSEILGVDSIDLHDAEEFYRYFMSLIHPEDRPAVGSAYQEFLAGKRARFDIEFRMRHASGEWVWVHSLGDVMQRSADGRAEHAIGVMTDITRNKLAKTRLQQLNQLREDLLRSATLEEKLGIITARANEIFYADFTRIWIVLPGDRCDCGCPYGPTGPKADLCKDKQRCLHLMASSGRYTHIDGGHGRVPFGCFKIGRIASGDEPGFCTNDVVNDPKIHDPQWASELGLKSFAGHRLLSNDGQPIGVLAQFSKRMKSEEEDIDLAGVANTAAQIVQLALAEENLKILGGLLPICAKCKQIRDDQGYWNNLEHYIETHSQASFSHGLCEPCMEELYRGEAWYQKLKAAKKESKE